MAAKTRSITREELDEMFRRQREEVLKEVSDKCDSCAHHDCGCPDRIKALDKATDARMDRLDENDRIIQNNIEKVYVRTEEQVNGLREATEEELAALKGDMEGMRRENDAFADMNLKLTVVVGACVGVMLVMGAVLVSIL